MTTVTPGKPVETRRESGAWKAKHARILAAALDEFIERGFNGVSMDRIAAKAKVSKVTIYNHFENKDLLYRQMIDYYLNQVHPGAPTIQFQHDVVPKENLVRYGVSLISTTAQPRSIGMIRLLRADPQVFTTTAGGGRDEYRLLPDGTNLASYLSAETKHGRLRINESDRAARQFIGMMLENTVYPALSGAPVQLVPAAINAIVESSVDVFLSYYGVG